MDIFAYVAKIEEELAEAQKLIKNLKTQLQKLRKKHYCTKKK